MKKLINILTVAILATFIIGCEVEKAPEPKSEDGDYTIVYNEMFDECMYEIVYSKNFNMITGEANPKDTVVNHFEVEFLTNDGFVTKDIVDTVDQSNNWHTKMFILFERTVNTPDTLKVTVTPKDTENTNGGYITAQIYYQGEILDCESIPRDYDILSGDSVYVDAELPNE